MTEFESDDFFSNIKKAVKPPKTPEEAHEPAMARGADCRRCPFWGLRQGPVLGEVVPNTKLFVLGQEPGNEEVSQRRPFVGKSGTELNVSLERGGLRRDECTVTNRLLCKAPPPESVDDFLDRLEREYKKKLAAWEKAVELAKATGEVPDDKPPLPPGDPYACCAPRLERDIQESNPQTFLAVGAKALEAMAQRYGVPYGNSKEGGFAGITDQHGAPVRMADGRVVCSSLHPAFAMRAKEYTEVVRENIARAAWIASRDNTIDWRPPDEMHIFPDIDTVERVCRLFVDNNARVGGDIETDDITHDARIRLVGLYAVIDGREIVISVPFRWRDGRPYWSVRSLGQRAQAAVLEVLDRCKLVFHNGIFDTAKLLRYGLMSDYEKEWDDTLYLHTNTDWQDLPHDLGFVVRQLTMAPLWKKNISHKAGSGTTDEEYSIYNADDCVGMMRALPLIEQRVADCGTWQQYYVDRELLPILRDMGQRIGVFIDEKERGKLSGIFNQLVINLTRDFQKIVGYPINPNAPGQIAKWLFEQRGYVPPLTPDGEEWEEGEKWSTSIPALFELQRRGVLPEDAVAIDKLLEFRACALLRSRYIDGLAVDYKSGAEVTRELAPAVYVEQIVDGKLTKVMTLPERPAVSRLWINWRRSVPTGRWACDPSVMNWPTTAWAVDGVPTNTRKMIIAPPGHKIVGGDYKAIEVRGIAVIARDHKLVKWIKEDKDIHAMTAAGMFADKFPGKSKDEIYNIIVAWKKWKRKGNESEAELKKHEAELAMATYLRVVGKKVRFSQNYGVAAGEEGSLFSILANDRDKATNKRTFKNLSPKEVDIWDRVWHEENPEIDRWQRAVEVRLRDNGFTCSPIEEKRKRFFRHGTNKKNAPANMEVQGFAASACNRAVRRIAKQIKFQSWSEFTGLCIQNHDDLRAYVPEDRAEEAVKIMEEEMFYKLELNGIEMPCPADCAITDYWE